MVGWGAVCELEAVVCMVVVSSVVDTSVAPEVVKIIEVVLADGVFVDVSRFLMIACKQKTYLT